MASQPKVKTKDPPLVLIEWEDSTQPVPGWQHVEDIAVTAVRVASVGWLIENSKMVKALAPNVGGLNGEGCPQCSGVIAIPARCVISITEIKDV